MFLALLQWYSLVSSIFKIAQFLFFCTVDKTVQNWPARLQYHSFAELTIAKWVAFLHSQ
jgi:hypothetical protein